MSKVINLSILMLFILNSTTLAFQVVPFQLVGNLIIISATVDDKRGNYVIDTGVPTVTLNGKYFQGKKSEKVMQGVNGEGSQVFTRYSNIEIAGSKWKGVYVEIVKIESIERALNRPIHGLLGCQLFRKHMLEFDYQKMEMTISKPDKKVKSTWDSGNGNWRNASFKFRGQIPVINAQIDSKKIKLILDTGSAPIILGENRQNYLTANSIKWDSLRVAGFGKTAIKTMAGTVFNLQIGEITCAPMLTVFKDKTDLQLLCPGQSVDGVLGYEFLKQVRTTINFKDKTISFTHINATKELDLVKKPGSDNFEGSL